MLTRPTIHVATKQQTPFYYCTLAQKFLRNHPFVDMTGLENAIATALDTANLLQRNKMTQIVRYVNEWRIVYSARESLTRSQSPDNL